MAYGNEKSVCSGHGLLILLGEGRVFPVAGKAGLLANSLVLLPRADEAHVICKPLGLMHAVIEPSRHVQLLHVLCHAMRIQAR